MSKAETTLKFAEGLIHACTGQYLSELQRLILLTILQRDEKIYRQIAQDWGYSVKYVQDSVAPQLWQLLSLALETVVEPGNVRQTLEQRMQDLNFGEEEEFSAELQEVCRADRDLRDNILVVDDQLQNLDLLSTLLEEQGYEVRQALDPLKVMESVVLAPPDLILLDINMPQMDGYTLCKKLKENPQTQQIPVVFISALDEPWDKVKAFAAGGVDYITKPFKVVEVLARVKNHLKMRQLQQELQQQNAHLQGLVIQLRQANQELERLSAVDSLTQVANRRRFDQYFEQAWGCALREQQPLALILCDIDYFKRYNDTYGHQAGDRCLLKVAQTLQQSLHQAGDLVCRYGGEEFAIVLPGMDLAGSQQVGETLLHQVQALQIPHENSPIGPVVTISVGATSTVPQGGVEAGTLVRLCDRALYQAKAQGRNRMIALTAGD